MDFSVATVRMCSRESIRFAQVYVLTARKRYFEFSQKLSCLFCYLLKIIVPIVSVTIIDSA